MIDLQAIRARAEAATKGPWTGTVNRASGHGDIRDADGLHLARWQGACREADASFIAHARADIPALLEEVARLRAIVSACEGVGVSVVALPDGRTAVNNVRAMRAESACEWVPVGVRLPEVNCDVLVFVEHAMAAGRSWQGIAFRGGDGTWLEGFHGKRFDGSFGNVTHWMPLPSPPEGR